MSIFIKIKPISINQAYTGRRFKTDKYAAWCKEIAVKLPPQNEFKGRLQLDVTFGYSSHGSDIDNALKPLLDVLQKKYQFNDNQIYELRVKKEVVKKGSEFIEVDINGIGKN